MGGNYFRTLGLNISNVPRTTWAKPNPVIPAPIVPPVAKPKAVTAAPTPVTTQLVVFPFMKIATRKFMKDEIPG